MLESERPAIRVESAALAGSFDDRYLLPLSGRAHERSEIEQALRTARSGEPALTVLVGEPGVGKTRLLQDAIQRAEEQGWATMLVAPDVDSTTSPHGALIDAAMRAQLPSTTRDELKPLLKGPAPQYWLTRVLADGLEEASARSGVVVVIDDLQWLDQGSLGVVSALMHDLDGTAICWLIATRTGTYSAAHGHFVARAARDGSLLEVLPLTDDAVEALARDTLGGPPGPGVTTALRRTSGYPLLVLELLRGLQEEGLLQSRDAVIDVGSDRLPSRFGASARERLRQLSRETLTIAQVGSVFGREFPLHTVLDVIGRSAAEAAPDVQNLLDLGFLSDTGTRLAFRHDTVQAAASDTLTPTLRRAVTREVLGKRLEAGESAAALASTIAFVAEGGDDESIGLLLSAAHELSPTDTQGAADLVVLSARLAADHPMYAGPIAELIPVVLAGGRTGSALEIVDLLQPLLDADGRARVSLAMARQYTESDFDAAIRETGEALDIPGLSRETQVQLLAIRALNFANKADAASVRATLDRARSVADEDRDGLALATIDATESVLRFYENDFDAAERLQRRALDRVAALGRVEAFWMPEGLWLAFMRNTLGYGQEALDLCEEGLTRARGARDVIAESYWRMVATRVLYDLGRLDEARTQAETVLELSAQLRLGDFSSATAGVVLHRIALHTGDVQLRDAARPLIEQLADGIVLTRTGRWSLALEALDRGRLDEAHDHAAVALETLCEACPSMTIPSDLADDIVLAMVCRDVGDVANLDQIVQLALERSAMNPSVPLARAVSTAVRGVRDASVPDLLDAADQLVSVGRPLVSARVLERAAHVAPDGPVVTSSLKDALRIYEDAGADRDVSRVLHRLRTRGVRVRPRNLTDGLLGLSSRERQVAERVAAGLTTQQIADELLLSPHTVVTYVRHIYAKWDLNTRREIAARFHEITAG